MTVLSQETRLVGTGAGLLPRVNLLPPEIAEREVFRRCQIGMGAALLATAGVVGLLVVGASQSVSSAKSDLAGAQSEQSSLQVEAAKYKNVTAIYAAADAAQAQLASAMGDEVRYSQLLTDLSLTVPSNVWVASIAFSQTAPGTAPATGAASTTAATPAAAATSGPIGTLTVSGTGFSHDDVAAWLEAIGGLRTYDSPYFSSSTESLLGTKPIVNFTSTANVTPKALSGRYTKSAGN